MNDKILSATSVFKVNIQDIDSVKRGPLLSLNNKAPLQRSGALCYYT